MSVQPIVESELVEPLRDEGYLDRQQHLINRDLSQLEFFERVLEEAEDPRNPLLERVKFISILSSNLDEFFMIRVAGIRERSRLDPDDADTAELLTEIKAAVAKLVRRQIKCLRELHEKLDTAGVRVRWMDSLTSDERAKLDEHFEQCVYPLLTPQTVDPTHPFPYISGGNLNLCMFARPKVHRRTARILKNDHEFFLRIKVPPFLPRVVAVPGSSSDFVLMQDLILANVGRLVIGAETDKCYMFRITRGADIELQESEAEDLLEAMEENLKQRRFGDVVRLEVSRDMPAQMVDYLKNAFEIDSDDVYRLEGLIDTGALTAVCKVDRPELKDRPLNTVRHEMLDGKTSIFDAIRKQDILLHHPYHPYSTITDLLREAVEDEDILAIKMCLYRIGAESTVAPLLIRASELGKQVTALIEIKARFDEANNIEWAKRLERAGVNVVYGHIGLKTHCKTTLIVRREEDALARYVHVATGNYNPDTSPFYTDLSLLTCDPEIGADATELFNYLTAYSQRAEYHSLLVAPVSLREQMIELIRRETENAKQGRPAGIIAKMNRLADAEICRALYEASQAGVPVRLIVRGICTLRPGIKGLSENIQVRTIVGRLLEHSRVYWFENAGDPQVYTGSADWMPRNLDRRIEVLAPVREHKIKRYLRETFLESYLRDNVKARELQPDGTYRRAAIKPGEPEFDSQLSFQDGSNILQFSAANS